MRCAGKNFGEMSTNDRHKVYFLGEGDRREYRVGFLVHRDMLSAVLECRPVSSRLLSIRLRAIPFNITIIQVYAQTSGPGCSKLTVSLVNVSLKFQTLISNICQYFLLKNVRSFCSAKASLIFATKNNSVFAYKVIKHLMS